MIRKCPSMLKKNHMQLPVCTEWVCNVCFLFSNHVFPQNCNCGFLFKLETKSLVRGNKGIVAQIEWTYFVKIIQQTGLKRGGVRHCALLCFSYMYQDNIFLLVGASPCPVNQKLQAILQICKDFVHNYRSSGQTVLFNLMYSLF